VVVAILDFLGRVEYLKSPSFRTDFKSVHMALVKSAHKKVLPNVFKDLGKFSIGKIVFWLKHYRTVRE
jgi:hypothetical protein